MSNYFVTVSIIVLIIHYFLPLIFSLYLMTAAHEEIVTGGQIRGVGELNQQTLSK